MNFQNLTTIETKVGQRNLAGASTLRRLPCNRDVLNNSLAYLERTRQGQKALQSAKSSLTTFQNFFGIF